MRFVLHLPDSLPLVRVDAALVVQLITNLLDNIMRHAPQGRVVEVFAVADADRVRVAIEDDGPGLPPGDTERLFAKFQRGRAEGDARGRGARTCHLSSDCGSPWRDHPRSEPHYRERRPFRIHAADAGGVVTDAMFRVLVVEDDAHIRSVLRTLLESAGYRVELAENAARALVEARANRPDAMLIDLGLPDRDGQQLIRDVREFSTVPVLVLSARSAEQQKIMALDGGADDYVTKAIRSG